MRSEKRITARMMCSIMMIVMPCAFSRKRMVRMSSTSALDSPAIASSEIEQLRPRGHGAGQLELAHLDLREPGRPQVRLRVEPDRFAGSPSPRRRASAPARPARAAYSSGMPRFSSTVMLRERLGDLEAPHDAEPGALVRRAAR